MSPERDTERLLRQWLDEGPTRAADRLLENVEGRMDRQRQRPAWRLSWRNVFMNRTIGSFAAGMAVVAVALIGYNVLAGQGKDGAGIGTPTEPSAPVAVTPSPTPTPATPSEAPPAGSGLTVSFTGSLPDGWEQDRDTFLTSGDVLVEVLEDRSVMSPIPECINGPASGVGKSASEFVEALATREGLEVTGPEAVEVSGLSGQVLELHLADGWTGSCPWSNEVDIFVPLFGTFDEKNYWLYNGVVGEEHTRLYVLDKPDGGNVVIAAWAPNADLWVANEADITSIVGGIQIDLGS
jgi:hypothetical protein